MKKKLIIIQGLQGTGKTIVAKILSKKLNIRLLRTDVIRKELLKHPKYTEKEMNKIYNEMFRRATKFLKQKKDVILDATFSKKKFIKRAKAISKNYNSQLIIIHVKCNENIIKKRLSKRKDESDADFDIYLKSKKTFEFTIPDIKIDNSGTLANTKKQINKFLKELK